MIFSRISRQSIAIASFVPGPRVAIAHSKQDLRANLPQTDLTVVVGQQAPAPVPSFGGHPPLATGGGPGDLINAPQLQRSLPCLVHRWRLKRVKSKTCFRILTR